MAAKRLSRETACGAKRGASFAVTRYPVLKPLLDEANERASEPTRSERAVEAARESACRGVRGAKPLGKEMKIETFEMERMQSTWENLVTSSTLLAFCTAER